jgi:Zn-dependent peptidase ImmA (M78 family)
MAHPVHAQEVTRLRAMVGVRRRLQDKLAAAIRINPNTVGSLLREGRLPRSGNVLGAMAQDLNAPSDYIGIEGTVRCSIPTYRSNRQLETQWLVESGTGFGVLAWDALGLVEAGREKVRFPLVEFKPRSSRTPREIARDLRQYVRLSDTPIKNMWELAASLGVIVVFGPADQKQLKAYSLWIEDTPFIVLNPADEDICNLRFDIAHELAHFIMHADPRDHRRDQMEAEADAFARELLFPTSEKTARLLQRALVAVGDWQRLVYLKHTFGLSLHGFLKHARQFDFFTPTKARKWASAYKVMTSKARRLGQTELAQPREEAARNLLREAADRLFPTDSVIHELVSSGMPEDVMVVLLSTSPTDIRLDTNTVASSAQQELDFGDWKA